jgi:hypothetical protein
MRARYVHLYRSRQPAADHVLVLTFAKLGPAVICSALFCRGCCEFTPAVSYLLVTLHSKVQQSNIKINGIKRPLARITHTLFFSSIEEKRWSFLHGFHVPTSRNGIIDRCVQVCTSVLAYLMHVCKRGSKDRLHILLHRGLGVRLPSIPHSPFPIPHFRPLPHLRTQKPFV